MSKIIEIKKLKFNYENNSVFDGLDLIVDKGSWVAIAGPNGCGKSTLVKLIVGILKRENHIYIDGLQLNNKTLMEIRRRIGVVFQNPDNQFVAETAKDDIAFPLENLEYPPEEIHYRVEKIAKLLKIEDILEKEPHRLSGGQKQKVALASALVINPKILILDEALSMIDPNDRKDILEVLTKLHAEQELTIITISHNLEESLFADKLILINKGKVIVEGIPTEVLKQDKIINKLGLELPFMVDLSIKLQFYGLLNRIILDMDEMVVELWK